MTRDPDTISAEIEAVQAALMTRLDSCCTGIFQVLDNLKWTTDQLLDHVIVEQFTWAREGLEHLAPLVDDCLAQSQAAAGAALRQFRHAEPDVATVQQHS
jgi:hypothetical protein